MDWLEAFLSQSSYWGLLLALLACGFGLPVPEDLILITGGVLAHPSQRHFLLTVLVCMVGVLGGDSIVFALGHHFRDRILAAPPFRWLVSPKRLRRIRALYRKYGYWAIFMSRFLAGLRATSFLMAGMSQVPYRVFFLADGVAALISVPLFVWIGYFFADNVDQILGGVHRVKSVGLWGLGALVVLYLLKRLVWDRWRGRRGEVEEEGPAEGDEGDEGGGAPDEVGERGARRG